MASQMPVRMRPTHPVVGHPVASFPFLRINAHANFRMRRHSGVIRFLIGAWFRSSR